MKINIQFIRDCSEYTVCTVNNNTCIPLVIKATNSKNLNLIFPLMQEQFNPNIIVQSLKISLLPPQKGMEFPRGWGLPKTKTLKEMYQATSNWNLKKL